MGRDHLRVARERGADRRRSGRPDRRTTRRTEVDALTPEERRELALRPPLEVVDRTVVETNPTFRVVEDVDKTVVDTAQLPTRLRINNRPRTRSMTRPYEEGHVEVQQDEVIDVEPEWETLAFEG